MPADLPGITSDQLAALARTQAPRVALLEVEDGKQLPSGGDGLAGVDHGHGRQSRQDPAFPDRRPCPEGRADRGAVLNAADVQKDTPLKRPARVVFPNGPTHAVARWICSAPLDLAVFEIDKDCDALFLNIGASQPPVVAVIGYPLVEGVGVFGEKANPYAGGNSWPSASRRRRTAGR